LAAGRVWAAAAGERGLKHPLRDERPHAAAAEPAAPRVQEQSVVPGLEPRPLLEPGRERLLRAAAEQHHALLAALAEDPHHARPEVELVHVERHGLGATYAGPVKELQDRAAAEGRRAVTRHLEERRDLRLVE